VLQPAERVIRCVQRIANGPQRCHRSPRVGVSDSFIFSRPSCGGICYNYRW
jgi:hypothetical protein